GLWFIPHAVNIFRNFQPSADFFQTVGFRPGPFFAALIAVLEALLGVFFIIGFYVQASALIAAVILVTAAVAVVRLNGRKWIWLGGGVEFPLFWASICLMLAYFS